MYHIFDEVCASRRSGAQTHDVSKDPGYLLSSLAYCTSLVSVSLRLRPVTVSWQGISTILYSTLSQLSSSIIGTIELVLLLPSTESETALQLHKDGPNLPAQLRKIIADPRFDMLENVVTGV